MAPVPSQRDRLTAEAARLTSLRDDLDPAGAAYQRTSAEIDDVLAQIWELGPVEV